MKKHPSKILLVSIFFLHFAVATCGQNVYFPGVVPFINISAGLSNKLDLTFLALSKIRIGDYNIRSEEYPAGPTQFYSHLILTAKMKRGWQLGGGLAFQRNDPFRSNWRNDFRISEQIAYNFPGTKWKLNSRLRLEERWFQYPKGPSDFGTRIRFISTLIHPLKAPGVYWRTYDEIYAIPSGPRKSFVSENWFYTGIGFPISESSTFDTGFACNSTVLDEVHDLNTLLMLQIMWSYHLTAGHKKKRDPGVKDN